MEVMTIATLIVVGIFVAISAITAKLVMLGERIASLGCITMGMIVVFLITMYYNGSVPVSTAFLSNLWPVAVSVSTATTVTMYLYKVAKTVCKIVSNRNRITDDSRAP